MAKISVFLLGAGGNAARELVGSLRKCDCVDKIFLLSSDSGHAAIPGTEVLQSGGFGRTDTIRLIAGRAEADYSLLITKSANIDLGAFTLERFLNIAEESGAGILYSDYIETKNGIRQNHPTIDYQTGSVRDDFDFGPLLFISREALHSAAASMIEEHRYAGLYHLRLNISREFPIMRIPEYLYSFTENDFRSSGQKQFDYVNPRNRELQIEMERVLTGHLKKTGAFLKPDFAEIDLFKEEFKTEASVIIPVKNRIKTIGDAVNSALSQKTDFRFNVIVVDNFSDDGTTELLRTLSAVNKNLIHLVPARSDLLIGGCWNLAAHNELCGRFAVQLDSDDIYKDQNTLQTIVDTFREEKCGMVIGAYILTDFSLNEIEPGLVDHREWTPENGPNNALRINGLGAPRAFYTPLLRKLGVPNVSYGEDYYLGLRISRKFKIGRIYKPVYLCRRWEENTDSSLDIVKLNNHNQYKDRLRTFEILSRKKINSIK